MQKPSAWRKQCIAISRMVRNFAQLENSRSVQKFTQCTKILTCTKILHMREFPLLPIFRPFCIFSNFTPDVILTSSYVYVISFVNEHYISSVKLVANQSVSTGMRLLVPVFPFFFFSPIFFHFLVIQTRLDDDKSRHAWLKPLHP